MRGPDFIQDTLFSVQSLESYVPADRLWRPVRGILSVALKRMNPLFAAMHATGGRDSIAPAKLLRALMLQVLYGVRSERVLIEQFGNLLFRWFVGLSMRDQSWDRSSLSKEARLTPLDRFVLGLTALFVSPCWIATLGAPVKPAKRLKFRQVLGGSEIPPAPFRFATSLQPGSKGPSAELIAAIVEVKRRNPRFGYVRIA